MKLIGKKVILAAAITAGVLIPQSFNLNAQATDISGVEGNNGIYNIHPDVSKGDIGFRHYGNFVLSEGDIANLIFKYGAENVSKFVNLVDNTININGIVNSMRDGNFYDGHAIFISPKGMVVGASGVLNVGALSVMTPSQSDYKKYIDSNYEGNLSTLEHGTADVTINGKVLSRGDINIIAKDATVTSNGALLAGINNTEALTSRSKVDMLFNSLVNATEMKTGNTLALQDGNIVIKTEVRDGGINVAGLVKNNGKGDISLINNGSQDLKVVGKVENTQGNILLNNRQSNTVISGNITNADGNTNIINNKGELRVGHTGDINNKGELRLVNRGENGMTVNGNVTNDGVTLLSSNNGKVVINGNIKNQNGRLTVVNNGSGLEINDTAKISNNDEIKIANTGNEGFIMNGEIKNNGSTALTNWYGDFIIGGSIENESGKMNLSNAGPKMHLTDTSKVVNNGDLQIINSGVDGLTLDGTVENTSTTNIWSVKGDLDVNGTVSNSNGKLTITNDGNALNIGENAIVMNDASTVITNTGEGGLNHNGLVFNSGNTIVDNQAGDMNINGVLAQAGNRITVKNSGNALNINRTDEDNVGGIGAINADVTIFNTGKGGTNISGIVNSMGEDQNISVVNQAGGLTIDGGLLNENGDISISNSGDGALYLTENSVIDNLNGKVGILNTSEQGARIDSNIRNNGITNITNRNGHLQTDAKIANQNGKLEIVNNGSGLTIGGNAHITNNDEIKIANTGKDGFTMKGNIENNGSTALSNWAGDFVISGKVENQDGKMNITSAQDSNGLHLTKEGQLINNNDELYVQNTGANGMILDGEVKNNSSTTLYNLAGNMEVNGLVQNNGELMVSNRGQNLTVGKDAIIKNNGKTTIRNTGVKGMNIDGTIINENDVVNVENRAGTLNMSKDAQIINRKADINIKNQSAAAMNLDGSIYNLEGDDINVESSSEKGGMIIGSNALLSTSGDVNLKNTGAKGIKVRGTVSSNNINVDNKDSHIILGDATNKRTEANLKATNDVNINLENGSVLNAGTKDTLIATEGDLNIKVDNGKIGVETGSSGGGYTYGPNASQVDTSKSINIDVAGKINAETNDTLGTTGDYVINLASKGTDLNVDHIKADGRVILLADVDENGNIGSIKNVAEDATRPNIEAKGFSLISSGAIGEEGNELTFNDTNYAYKSDVLAIDDINMKALDDEYDQADVRYIISKNGNINAEFTGLARVKDTYAGGGTINITNRTGKMNIENLGSTPNTESTYFDYVDQIMPLE